MKILVVDVNPPMMARLAAIILRERLSIRIDSPVGQHVSDCCDSSINFIGESLTSAATLKI